MKKKNQKGKVFFCGVFAITLSIGFISTDKQVFAEKDYNKKRISLTEEIIEKIKAGEIRLEGSQIDSSLLDTDVIMTNEKGQDNTASDFDSDTIPTNKEIYVYKKDGNLYVGYDSHPVLEDTDGDGILDNQEKDGERLIWNVSDRDLAMFQELSYRDDDYIKEVLDDTKDVKPYENRNEYLMMNKELAPYWKVKRTYHENNGFDAVLFETKSSFPYLPDGKAQVLAIRGTKGATDVAQDLNIGLGYNLSQATTVENLIQRYATGEENLSNLYITGHSLGGYLTQRAVVWAYQLATNSGVGDASKKQEYQHFYNDILKGAVTFNAPRVTSTIFHNDQYYKGLDSTMLAKQGRIKHYVVENDKTVGSIYNDKDTLTSIGSSAAGHGSRSYFEARVNNLPFFTVGKRNTMDESGYRDPKVSETKPVEFGSTTPITILVKGKLSDETIKRKLGLADTDTIQLSDLSKTSDFDTSEFGKYILPVYITHQDKTVDKKYIEIEVQPNFFEFDNKLGAIKNRVNSLIKDYNQFKEKDPEYFNESYAENVEELNTLILSEIKTLDDFRQNFDSETNTQEDIDKSINEGLKDNVDELERIMSDFLIFETRKKVDETFEKLKKLPTVKETYMSRHNFKKALGDLEEKYEIKIRNAGMVDEERNYEKLKKDIVSILNMDEDIKKITSLLKTPANYTLYIKKIKYGDEIKTGEIVDTIENVEPYFWPETGGDLDIFNYAWSGIPDYKIASFKIFEKYPYIYLGDKDMVYLKYENLKTGEIQEDSEYITSMTAYVSEVGHLNIHMPDGSVINKPFKVTNEKFEREGNTYVKNQIVTYGLTKPDSGYYTFGKNGERLTYEDYKKKLEGDDRFKDIDVYYHEEKASLKFKWNNQTIDELETRYLDNNLSSYYPLIMQKLRKSDALQNFIISEEGNALLQKEDDKNNADNKILTIHLNKPGLILKATKSNVEKIPYKIDNSGDKQRVFYNIPEPVFEDADEKTKYYYLLKTSNNTLEQPIIYNHDYDLTGDDRFSDSFMNLYVDKREETQKVIYESNPSAEYGTDDVVKNEGSPTIVTSSNKYTVDPIMQKVVNKVSTTINDNGSARVISKGTKTKVVKEVIQPETEYKADSNTEAYTKNKTEGRSGEKITTTTYTLNTTTGEITSDTQEDRKDAVNTVITIGTKSKVEKETLPVEYRADNNKEYGSDDMIEEGVDKEITTTYTLDETAGKLTEKKEVTNPGKAKVIIKGTKAKVLEEELPFTTEYKADSSVEANTRITVEGHAGKKITTTTYTLNTATGKITSDTQEDIKNAVNTIVTVGTKPNIVTSKIPFKTTYEADKSLALRETKLKRAGKDGSKTITTTYTLNTNSGVVTPTVTEETVDAVDAIVLIGNVDVHQNTIEIENKYIEDKAMLRRESKTVVGKEGKAEVTTTYEISKDGKLINPQEKQIVLEKMVPTVVYYGVKVEVANQEEELPEYPIDKLPDITEKEEKETLPTRYQADEEKEYGSPDKIQEGEDKVTKITYKFDETTGEFVEVRNVTNPGKAKVIIKGTKAKIEEVEIPFKTEYKEDPDAEANTRITIEGRVGKNITTTTYILNPSTGEITSHRNYENVPSVNTLITVGTKPTVITSIIPFKTIYETDNTLALKEKNVKQKGRDGSTTTTIAYTLDKNTGVLTSSKNSATTNAVDSIIMIGNIETIVKPIKIETQYIKDKTMLCGENNIVVGKEGKIEITTTYEISRDGELVNPQENQIILEKMIPTIVHYGVRLEVANTKNEGKKQVHAPKTNDNTYMTILNYSLFSITSFIMGIIAYFKKRKSKRKSN